MGGARRAQSRLLTNFCALGAPRARDRLSSRRYNTLGALLPHVRKEGVDLLNEMLTYDPDKRLSAR